MTVEHYLEDSDPIRKQLLGVSYSGGRGYTSPTPEDVPLRDFLSQQTSASSGEQVVTDGTVPSR